MTQATPEQVRQITQDILTRPEFLERPTWSQFMIERVGKWIQALIDWSSKNPDLSKVLAIVLTVILVLLLTHIVYTVGREFFSQRKPYHGIPRGAPLGALEGIAENWNDAFRLAKNALDAGELYKAVWVTHRVLLSVLDRMGEIKFVRWKTNTDYIRECPDDGRARTTLSEVTAAYERVIYAHGDIDRIIAAQLLAQVEALAGEASR